MFRQLPQRFNIKKSKVIYLDVKQIRNKHKAKKSDLVINTIIVNLLLIIQFSYVLCSLLITIIMIIGISIIITIDSCSIHNYHNLKI